MTQKNVIELLQAADPSKGDIYLRLLLNVALREFCEETGLLSGTSTITTEEGVSEYDLPEDFLEMTDVRDESGRALVRSSKSAFALLPSGTPLWWMDGETVFIAAANGESTTPLAAGRTITLFYTRAARPFTPMNMDAEIDLPGQYQLVLEARIMERLSIGNPQAQAYWHAVWRDTVKRAKATSNIGGDATTANVLLHDLL